MNAEQAARWLETMDDAGFDDARDTWDKIAALIRAQAAVCEAAKAMFDPESLKSQDEDFDALRAALVHLRAVQWLEQYDWENPQFVEIAALLRSQEAEVERLNEALACAVGSANKNAALGMNAEDRIASLTAELTAAHAALDAQAKVTAVWKSYEWTLFASDQVHDLIKQAESLTTKARELRARREGK